MSKEKDVICWWSGGVTSAVAGKIALELFPDRCRFVFMDTQNEDEDTYRFKSDCEKWYGQQIETITAIGGEYKSISDVWLKYKSLNVAKGAVCSSTLKRQLREKWEKENTYAHQVFGFDWSEFNRAKSMAMNYPNAKPIFPLLLYGLTKADCIEKLQHGGIEIPKAYSMGFHNNNCLNTGCVQGGIGYWQKMNRDFPAKFDKMAEMEHRLTALRGEPVTMLKDQSREAKETGNVLVFLKPHPDYPELKSIDDMEGREPEPLVECNGFCGTNDLSKRTKTEKEINFQTTLF